MAVPHISVVVPAYNAASTLGDAVASALAQSVDEVEIIVVDDGSTDRTADAALESDSARLHLIRHNRNLGAAAARNTGITAARGKLIAFLDSDDRWFPDKLEKQIDVLALCTGPEYTGSVHSVLFERAGGEVSPHLLPAELDLRHDLMWGCRLCPGSSLLVTRDCLDRVGPFDATLERLEDWDWLLRFSEHYRLAVATAPLALVRHSSSASRAQVDGSLQHLREKHTGMIARLDWIERRKLESTFLIERAGAEYRGGYPARAMFVTARALLRYPFRNASFFRRMGQIVLECATGRAGGRAGAAHVSDARKRAEHAEGTDEY